MHPVKKYLPKIINTPLKNDVTTKVNSIEAASPASLGGTLLLGWRRI